MLRNFFAREELVARHQEGQTLVEYGLLLSLIAIVVIGTLTLLGPAIDAMFQQILAAF